MKRKAIWWLMTLMCAVSPHAPAAADWLVTREGARIETRGAWKVKNQLVVFTLPNGTLSSLRLSNIDLPASERATAEARSAPAPAPSATETGKPRTVLTNDSVRKSTSAEQIQSQGQAAAGTSASVYEIGLPEAGWAMTLDLPGFKIQTEQERPDGQGKMMQAGNDRTAMIISIFVEREPGLGSAKKCRDFYWAKDLQAPIPKSEIAFSEYGPLPIVTWMVPEFQGVRVMQRNLKAFLGLRDICVDVHLSKVNYEPSDQALFDAVIRTIRIKEL